MRLRTNNPDDSCLSQRASQCPDICWVLIKLIHSTLKGCNPIELGHKFTSGYGTQSTVHDGENFFPLYFHLCDALIRLSWIEVDYGYWAPIIWLILEIPGIWTLVIVTDQSELFPQIWVNPVSDIFSEKWLKQDHRRWRYHRRLLDYQSPYFQLIIE